MTYYPFDLLNHINDSLQIDVTYYPFDTQMCELKFASWTTEVTRVSAKNLLHEKDCEKNVKRMFINDNTADN